MEENQQNQPTGTPDQSNQPASAAESHLPAPGTSHPQPARRGKILAGLGIAVVVVVALALVQRYWITPATNLQAHANGLAAAGGHPAAPDFSLPNIDGGRVNLADYKGKVVMVDFWATWCGPCRIEIPEFVELQNRYRDEGLAIIGISEDDGPEPVRDFYKEFRMNYPVAMGNDEVSQLYGGVIGLPTTFLIGRDGRIYAKHAGATDIAVFDEEIKTLLAAQPQAEVTGFTPAAMHRGDDIEVKTPEQIKAENNPDVPGVDLTGVSPEVIEQLKQELAKERCTCPCNMTVLECRHKDRGCNVSRTMAKDALDKLMKKTA